MSHVDPEVIALLALGETVVSAAERAHIAECAQCRGDLALLTATAHIGRSTVSVEGLESPSPQVWSRVSRELGLEEAGAADPMPVADASIAPVRPLRRFLPMLVGAAAASVVAVVAVLGWQLLRPVPLVPLASATLEPFPGWPTSSGAAQVVALADGTRELTIQLDAPDDDSGYREAWLLSTDGTRLISLGVIEGASATFILPRNVDLGDFSLVDVSLEPVDGDPAHSGDSIVRGPLASAEPSRST